MGAIYEYRLLVSDTEIDMIGHVNNVVYLQWMQDAALAHSAAQGWPAERYQQAGVGWVARLHQIEYLQPAYPGDQVIVRTWVSDMKKVTSTRRYQIIRNGMADSADGPAKETVLAKAHTNWAFIDFETRIPKRIPIEIASSFQVIEESL